MIIVLFPISRLPLLIVIGRVHHKHTFRIDEQLHRTSFRTQDSIRLTVNFIFEIQPCTGTVYITCMHHRHIVQHQWSIEPQVQVVNRSVDTGPLHVGIPYARIMPAERLPSILKVSDVSPMPDPPHRINLIELHPYAANIFKSVHQHKKYRNLLRIKTSVNGYHFAGNITGIPGNQKTDKARHFFRHPETAHRNGFL